MRRLLLLGASLGLACAFAQDFSVAGRVVDVSSESPLPRVRLTLRNVKDSRDLHTLTDSNGGFAFAVPQGKYTLTAEHRGVPQAYGVTDRGAGFSVAIIAGPDQDTSHLEFRWISRGAISGVVRDEQGDPIESMRVQIIRSYVSGGVRRTSTFGFTFTNDLGQYRMGYLLPGRYYVVVTGEPWYTRIHDTKRKASYAPTYYPNAFDLRGAEPLEIKAGMEASADLSVRLAPGAKVDFVCKGLGDRRALVHLITDGPEGVQSFQSAAYTYREAHSIEAVPPGRYLLRVTAPGTPPYHAEKMIDVGLVDTAVELEPLPSVPVSGSLEVSRTAPTEKPARLFIALNNEATKVIAHGTEPDAGGSFQWQNVMAGRYRVMAYAGPNLLNAQISAEGARVDGDILEVSGAGPVKLTITARRQGTGGVTGFVKKDGQIVPGALVVLAPTAGGASSSYRSFQADSDGSFEFTGIPAGDYKLYATPNLDLEYANRDLSRKYEDSVASISVRANESVSTSLTPID